MVKGRLTTGSSKPREASQLADSLAVGGNKKVYLTYNNQEIAVTDAIKTSGKVILITEVNGKAVQAKWLADELRQSMGLPVFVEIEGKEIPVQDIISNKIKANKREASNGVKDSLITLITMVFDATKGSERLLSQMVGSLTDQEVIAINNHLSRQPKLTKSQQSLLFTIKAELGKRNLTASKGKVNYNPTYKPKSYTTENDLSTEQEDQPLETEAADFVKPVFTDKDYEDFDAQVKSRFKVSAEVAESGRDTLSITFEPIRGGIDLENPNFQSQLEDFIKFTFGGEFKKAVTDIDTVEEDYLVILVDYSKVKVLKASEDSDLETEAAPKVTPMLKKDHPDLLKKTKAQLLVKKAMSIFSHNK